jgi:zinc protease
LLFEALNATAYVAHPYKNPVVGWMNDLQNMTAADALGWYQRWYAPNNATMVIAGDVDAKRVRELAEKYFAKIPAKTLPKSKPQQEPVQTGIKRIVVKAPAENAFLVMAYKMPKLLDVEKDDDVHALDVMAAVLDGYDNARLNRVLVKQEKVVNDVGVSYDMVSRGPELFLIGATLAKGKTVDQAQASIRKALEELKQKGVLESELKRIKVRILSEQIYKRDSIFGQAMEIGSNEMAGFSWKDIDYMLEKMQSITPAQVQAVAKKYLVDESLTIAVLDPQPRKVEVAKEGK